MTTGLPVRGSNRVMVIRTSPELQLAPELKQCGTLRGVRSGTRTAACGRIVLVTMTPRTALMRSSPSLTADTNLPRREAASTGRSTTAARLGRCSARYDRIRPHQAAQLKVGDDEFDFRAYWHRGSRRRTGRVHPFPRMAQLAGDPSGRNRARVRPVLRQDDR